MYLAERCCGKTHFSFPALAGIMMIFLFLSFSGCAHQANTPDRNEQPTAVSMRLYNAFVVPPSGPEWFILSYLSNEITYSRRTGTGSDPVVANTNYGAIYFSGSIGISKGGIWATKSYLLDKKGKKYGKRSLKISK